MESKQSCMLILCGPTSSGKTSLALELAKTIDAVIISADSRQIYRFMDIGTGKIPVNTNMNVEKQSDKWMIDSISVYGYDLVTPGQFFSAFDFAAYARKLINTLLSEHKNVILAGGTGYYIDMVTGRTASSGVGPDLELRAELNKFSLEALQDRLNNVSPTEFSHIDRKNKVRLVRALEKQLSTKTPDKALPELVATKVYTIGLTSPNEYIFEIADKWVNAVWHNGLVSETKKLISDGFADTAPLNGLIYKSVKKFLASELSEQSALERIKFDIHAYIRRQKTWFKKNPDVRWYDISVLSRSQIKADVIRRFFV